MSFLAPLFLLGAMAVALPVVFHLIRRSSRERTPFSSLMFLLPTPPRVTRRSRIENVFLLLLRCLVISLLAFAFARPFLSRPVTPDPAAQSGEKVLVLIDASASMRRGGLWREAKDKARTVFRNAKAADQVACFTFDREVKPVFNFEEWSLMPAGERGALAWQQLDKLSPGWGSTRLGHALITASELFESAAKDEQARKRIVVITDLQEGSRLDGLQGFEWPRGLVVSVEALRSQRTSNAGLQLASERDESGPSTAEISTRVRIINSSDSKREQFHIGWQQRGQAAYAGATLDAYIPPGQNRVVPLSPPSVDPAPDLVVLSGDEEEFDNTVYVIPSKAERVKILFVGNDTETDPAQSLYYLRRAFQESRSLKAEVLAARPGMALPEKDLGEISLVIVNDALPEDQIRTMKSLLDRGKTVLVVLSRIATTPTLGRILGEEQFGADEAGGTAYAMLGQIDFEHPLFAPFADPRYSDFTKIHFWKHRRVAMDQLANSRVLARFDNGDPALAEIPVGKGRVWVLTSGWQPEDSQLALSSKFVPLLYAMLEQSGGVKNQRATYVVGDAVNLADESEFVTVRKPDASEVKVAGGQKFNGTDQPGMYTINSLHPPTSFVVNLAPEESKTAPLPLEELERMAVPLDETVMSTPRPAQPRQEHLQAAQLENRQKLWRWLIVAALVVLVMETWLAGRVTRRALPATP